MKSNRAGTSEQLIETDRRIRTPQDLTRGDGPPLTTAQLAYVTGMSPTFIRAEIRAGILRAVVVGRGRRRVFRIPFRDAQRYVRKLGLI